MTKANYINRIAEKEALSLFNYYPVLTIIGPRQSGKTKLSQHCFKGKPYVNLEDIDERAFAKSDPRAFLQKYPEGAIIDEIQNVPELLSYIQTAVDKKGTNSIFVLTGSNQFALGGRVAQSLAGRTGILKLLPFSYTEIMSLKNYSRFFISSKPDMNELVFNGFYPRIYEHEIPANKFYRDYIGTYIERDVKQIVNIKDINLFRDFMKLMAGRIGQLFNKHSISNELGISVKTVNTWLSVLENSFIIFRLSPYYENFNKRVVKAPKYYFYDSGIATALLGISNIDQLSAHPLRGALFENLVIIEMMKYFFNRGLPSDIYYFRDSNGNEIDALFKIGDKFVSIEIKAAKTFNVKFVKNLEYFHNLVKNNVRNSYVIYTGDHEQKIDKHNIINFLNFSDYMNEIV